MHFWVQVFAALAALLHVLIFGMESLWFMRPAVHQRFGARSLADADVLRLFAFNQGFYNLFLAVGVGLGLLMLHRGAPILISQTLILFGTACMFAAGMVLIASAGRRMLRAGIIQALFPALTWACWLASM